MTSEDGAAMSPGIGDGPEVPAKDFEVRMPSGTDDPLSDEEIQKYRQEINRMDRTIIDAIHRRSAV